MVTGWTPDGKSVLFASARSTAFPPNIESFTVPVEGGAERKLPLFEGKEAHFAPTGDAIAFVRGPGTWYRKGYRGSCNDDIWICNADGTNAAAADARSTVRTARRCGRRTAQALLRQRNWAASPAARTSSRRSSAGTRAEGGYQRITQHEDDTVRRARISGNGEWIVYECGADLWVVGTQIDRAAAEARHRGERRRQVEHRAHRHVHQRRDRVRPLAGRRRTPSSPSTANSSCVRLPDGGKATRLTDSPAFDHARHLRPDGKSILFLSDRTGHEDIYLLEPDDPEHPELTKAHKFKVKQLTNTPEAELGVDVHARRATASPSCAAASSGR